MEPVTIRTAGPADVGALAEVFRSSSLSNEEDRDDLLAHPDALEWDAAPVAGGWVRVAEVGGLVVGFSTVRAVGDTVELEDLFVVPERMRLGVGRRLIDDVVGRARAAGASAVVVTANPRALAFYRRAGFRDAGQVSTRFGPAPRLHRPV